MYASIILQLLFSFSLMQICENGVISIGEEPFKLWRPQRFPSDNPLIHHSNILAPFWNDHEPNPSFGAVKYQMFDKGPDQSNQGINTFVAHQQSIDEFKGEWMIVVSWENVSPYTRCSDVQVSAQFVHLDNCMRAHYNYDVKMFLHADREKLVPSCDYL